MVYLISSLFGALLVAVTLPLILELALVTTARLIPGKTKNNDSDVAVGDVFILIPAHNEEGSIAKCVSSVLASPGENIRVVVIAHNCSDATAARAEAAGAEVMIYNDPEARGKGYALHRGFESAINQGANSVLVIDADSTISPNLILTVQRAFARGAEAVQCRYEMGNSTQKANGRLAALALRGFNVIRPMGRERLGLSTGILGNGFGLRSEVLRQIPYNAFSVVEDLEYHIHLVQAGKRVRYLEGALVTASLPESNQGETIQRSRWEGGRLRAAKTWFLPLLKQVLHGRFRLAEPMLDVAGLPIAYGAFALLLALCDPVGWVRIYAAMSLAIVLFHVLVAAAEGPDFLGTLGLLAMAPFYILWKIRLVPGVLRGSRAKAAWVRTQRGVQL